MDYVKYHSVCEYILGVLRTMALGEPLPEKPDDITWDFVYSVAASHTFAGALFYFLEDKISKEASYQIRHVLFAFQRVHGLVLR